MYGTQLAGSVQATQSKVHPDTPRARGKESHGGMGASKWASASNSKQVLATRPRRSCAPLRAESGAPGAGAARVGAARKAGWS